MIHKGTILFLDDESGFIKSSGFSRPIYFSRDVLSGIRFGHLTQGQAVRFRLDKEDPKVTAGYVYSAKAQIHPAELRQETSFKDLMLGYASAEEERDRNPDLLLLGFYDRRKITQTMVKGSEFLILGYKGSGKTAAGEHVRLLAANEPSHFVRSILLSDFPFFDFSTILGTHEIAPVRYAQTWSWILSLNLFECLSQDQGCSILDDPRFHYLRNELVRVGFLPAGDLERVIKRSLSGQWRINLPGIFEYEVTKPSRPAMIAALAANVKSIVEDSSTESTHLLIVDGLDDVLSTTKIQYEALSALIREAHRINSHFRRNGVGIKIIILCRTDLFDRLPGPNTNKQRQDSAVYLDWYRGTGRGRAPILTKIVTRRARLTNPRIDDVFDVYFPEAVLDKPVVKVLLDRTRHTPRDLIQLLRSIQNFVEGHARLTEEDVLDGLNFYSADYFLPEIRDELSGFMEAGEIEKTFRLLGAIRKKSFRMEDVSHLAETMNIASLNIERAFVHLFECGAVGNKTAGKKPYYTFKFRDRNASFNPNEEIVVQYGLWRGLNIRDR